MTGIDAMVPGFAWQLLFAGALLAMPLWAAVTVWQAGGAPKVLGLALVAVTLCAIGGVAFAPEVAQIAGWLR
jgi:uncharacterized membrane-anchored protein